MSERVTPIFIFSLPRSGSTLAQRILATHNEVSTASEPWILLPYLYTLRRQGALTEYGHGLSVTAIEDFCRTLPRGLADYLSAVREFALKLYAGAAQGNVRYFLDKTPRYHLIVEDVIRTFPEGKFIFLWRNPIAIVASIMETWAKGKWNLYRFNVDLFKGLENLVRAYQTYESKVFAVRYEDLVADPVVQWRRVFEYLELEFDQSTLTEFGHVKLQGTMGDPVGTKMYSHVSEEPIDKWKRTLANPVRKCWCKRYLDWIGEERLRTMGYDLTWLSDELDKLPNSSQYLGSDLLRVVYGACRRFSEPSALKRSFVMLRQWEHLNELG